MGDSENVKTEETLVSSEEQQYVFLHCPTGGHKQSLTEESPSIHDAVKKESDVEGETEDMIEECEDRNILPARKTGSPIIEPVLLQTTDINQNEPCDTKETEILEIFKKVKKTDLLLCEADADLDPDYKIKVRSDGKQQGLCMFFCQHCSKRFTTKQGLDRHMQALPSCQTRVFKCRYCRKCFTTQFCRRRHERRHNVNNNNNNNINNNNKRTTGLIIIPSSQVVRETQEMVSSQHVLISQPVSKSAVPDSEKGCNLDEVGKAKCSFACKYCKKVFGTHTSLRRHERRIHERRLLPRGVRQKVANCNEVQDQNSGGALEPSSNIHHSDDVRQEEEYMVDISSNISENLSFYIDGKIISTSAVTNCEVMELNAAAVIGMDAFIINPTQNTPALKMESTDGNANSDLTGLSSGRRRTSTPPLLPQIKTELESESILTTPSTAAEGTLIGTVFPRTLETIVLQKEKNIYLSPKLKQLLQNHAGSKSAFTQITEGQKMCPPLSLTLLPTASSRFKRRTTSPPSSTQPNSESVPKSGILQESDSLVPKLPKIDSQSPPAVISLSKIEEMEIVNLAANSTETVQDVLPLDCSASGTGGRSCNQRPLDLSSAGGKSDRDVLAECVLDLSIGKKGMESESAGCLTSQTSVRKSKPNSSMLEKVLLSQYAEADSPTPGDEIPSAVSEPIPANAESVTLALPPPPPPALNAAPSLPNSAAVHTASPAQPPLATPEPTDIFLPAQTSVTNQDANLVCPPAQSSGPVVLDTPVELAVGNALAAFNVSLPSWLNSTPGSVTHALIPTTPNLSLKGPQFLADTPVCELAQRTLVIDPVLSPEAHLISPVLVNQSNISSLSFSPNVVVIEYTVALESSNTTLVQQTDAVQSLSDKTPPDQPEAQELQHSSHLQTANTDASVPELPEAATVENQDQGLDSPSPGELENPGDTLLLSPSPSVSENVETTVEPTEDLISTNNTSEKIKVETTDVSMQHEPMSEEQSSLPSLCKRFMCNACDELFHSMKALSQHIGEHSNTWPYKCEFCVQLFESETALFEHRSSYHGIGKIYICKLCAKEFAFLCNLEQHQHDLHPGQECSHTEEEKGKLRPENYNSPLMSEIDSKACSTIDQRGQTAYQTAVKAEADDNFETNTEELYTTIKIMASESVKPKVTDVRLGINQHYPSFKPPPFPYHNRTPVSQTATTATNFTTHNIPQTFSTTVRCTKCGRGFDNMPELHKHILACANASDKKRYTPKKNPIPLKQFAKVQNGVLLPARGVNLRQNISQKPGHHKKLHYHESEAKTKLTAHGKRKPMWVQRGRSLGRKGAQDEMEVYVCPHCSREFTYHASLKKHVAFSCPMKPISRKPPKRKVTIASAQENHERVRTRVSDVIMKPQKLNQGPKSVTKTQTNGSGSASNVPEKAQIGKAKITVRNFQPKTSDILSSTSVHISKKSRLILMEAIQSPLGSKSLVALGKSPQQSNGVHCMERKIKQKAVELKPRTDERLLVRVKGPVTRSLQQVASNVTSNTNKQSDDEDLPARDTGAESEK